MSSGRGHALAGVRVQKVQRVQRSDTSSAVRVVVGACGASINAACGGAPLWCLYGHALAGVRVQKVQRVQRFDTAFGHEGCGGRQRRQYKCRR